MCGIVGVFGDHSMATEQAFADMLQMDVVRGGDSTGVAVIRKKTVDVLKDIWLPTDLLGSDEYKHINRGFDAFGFIGHNRAATKGKITADNAHPFQKGPITLVHNGTLPTMWGLPDYSKFESDSECITNAIALLGIEEAYKKINGAAALVWWNSEEQSLNMVTNGERPLAIGIMKDHKGIVFASETWMFRAACGRRGVDLAPKDAVHILDKDLMLSFRWNTKKKTMSMSTLKLTPYSPPKYERGTWVNGKDDAPFRRNTTHGRHTTNGNKALTAPNKDDNVIPLHGPSQYDRLNDDDKRKVDEVWKTDKSISEVEFHKKYRECAFCQESLEHEFEQSVVIDDNSAVCGGCAQMAKSIAMTN